ncbi:MCE family protein [Nocardioides carbamazepini]|uniref:MCE family protein n=1 Tax=Nocardioides carbamazepini TaxID=2854259 RepID=UPI00214A7C1A|nr:MCE family protein [Nocardioides carbamazepini]MCR1781792.1 MCE family protein [Nocardioides carbamazepini]
MTSARPDRAGRLLASVAVFVVVSVLLTVFVVMSVLDLGQRNGEEYHARLTDAAGLRSGDDVTVAGLEVGKVTDVELRGKDVEVTFVVSGGHTLHTNTRAAVRYANLIGTRYLALVPPDGAPAGRLRAGGTLPVAQSLPAVDLTAVFDGFQPLFDALDPEQVNQLTASIVAIFQGESGTVANLVEQVGTITTHLAGRKEVISTVITSLADLLTSVNEQGEALGGMIDDFGSVVGTLSDQRTVLASTIDGLATFGEDAAGLTRDSTDAINKGIDGVAEASAVLTKSSGAIIDLMRDIPDLVDNLNRIMDSGSFVKVYLCNLDLRATGRLNLSLVPGVPAPQDPVGLELPSGQVGDPARAGKVCR